MPNHRKKAVADHHVQSRLAFRVILHFGIFVCAGAILGIINQFLTNPMASLQETLAAFAQTSAPFLLALVCMLPLFVRDTLQFTNRIAGPIYNLRRTVRALADGKTDVSALRFRKDDFWQELATDFNEMTEQLRRQGAANQLAHTVAEDQQTSVEPQATCASTD